VWARPTGAGAHFRRHSFEIDRPAVVDLMTARHELSLPPAQGLQLVGDQDVLSGWEEQIELAKTNVRDLNVD
jgi:pyruvate dehydrogenase (quinone)